MSRPDPSAANDAPLAERLRFSALFEQAQDAVIVIGLDQRIIAANPAVRRVFGYEPEELVGRPHTVMIPDSEYEKAQQRYRAIVAGERPEIYERTMRRKDGRPIRVAIDVSLVRDDDGEPVYFQSIIRDISRLHREREALRSLARRSRDGPDEEFFTSLARSLADALIVECAAVVRVDGAPPEVCRTLGYVLGGMPQAPIAYDPADTPCEGAMAGEFVYHRAGVRDRFPHDEMLQAFGAEGFVAQPLVTRDGEVVGHLVAIDRGPIDDEVRARAVMQIFAARALSELQRRRQSAERHRTEARLVSLVESIPVATYIADLADPHDLSYISPQIEQITGFTPREWIGSRKSLWTSRLHPEDRDRAQRELRRTAEEAVPFDVEFRMLARDGRVVWIHEKASVIRDDAGKPVLLQGIMNDITESKRLEEESLKFRKLESVGILAGGIAHDFNNLLVGILGSLSVMKRRVERDPELASLVDQTESATLRTRGLAQELLTFAKGSKPIREPVDVRDLLRATVAFATGRTPVRVRYRFDGDLDHVLADAGQLERVFENLAHNAVQAMPGGGTLVVTARRFGVRPSTSPLPAGEYVEIRFADDGPGIPHDHLERIFDPYFSTRSGGTGLGLATAYAVIRKHDGLIRVDSNAGHGTTFSLLLPVAGRKRASDREAWTPARHDGRRVLLMDDEEIVRSTVDLMLSDLGFDVTTAAEGRSAVEIYRRALEEGRPFDLVILDLSVPDGPGGLATLRRLREVCPTVRAIVASGYSNDSVLADCESYGFRGRLAKPFRLADLEREVRRVLAQPVSSTSEPPTTAIAPSSSKRTQHLEPPS